MNGAPIVTGPGGEFRSGYTPAVNGRPERHEPVRTTGGTPVPRERGPGALLRELRLARGMDEFELSAETRLTLQAIARLETGQARPGGGEGGEDLVLLALDRRTPLSAGELLDYLERAGCLDGREPLRALTVLRNVRAFEPPAGFNEMRDPAPAALQRSDLAVECGGVC